jgi:transketolase C-terminal domain/subunit
LRRQWEDHPNSRCGALRDETLTTTRLYLFDTTTSAMWAEEVAIDRSIPAEVISAPADAKAKCSLALQTAIEHAPTLETALREEGVPFLLYE